MCVDAGGASERATEQIQSVLTVTGEEFADGVNVLSTHSTAQATAAHHIDAPEDHLDDGCGWRSNRHVTEGNPA